MIFEIGDFDAEQVINEKASAKYGAWFL